MPTYYDVLQLAPTATTADIENACDTQYHHWRRLVTHHDPQVVNQANTALQRLETIRATLTHPERRAVYDAQIRSNHTDTVGGLGDPAAAPGAVITLPPNPQDVPVFAQMQQSPLELEERVDAWVCPACQMANAIGNAYCKDCGETIGIRCPKCHQMIQANAIFCSHCGVNVANAARQNELEADLHTKQQALVVTERPIPDRAEEIKTLRRTTVSAGAWLIWAVSGLVWLFAGSVLNWHPNPIVVLGVQIATLIGLSILQKAFTFSAFLAGLLFVVDFLLDGGTLYHRPVYTFYVVDPITITVLGIYTIALFNVAKRLRDYRWGARLLVWLALLARAASAFLYSGEAGFDLTLTMLQSLLGEDAVWFSRNLVLLLLDNIQILVLMILTLRAWWFAHRFAHDVAAARLAQQQRIERLTSEIQQIRRELQSLGRRKTT